MATDSGSGPSTRYQWLGLGLVGLAVIALAVFVWRDRRSLPEGDRQGYVVTVTHGPDDADRVMLALFTATRLPEGDNHVWFAIDGGQLCKKGEAERVTSPLFTKQGNAAQLIGELRARGVAIHI